MKGLVILFMIFDSVSKLGNQADAVKGTLDLGYAEHHLLPLGLLGLLFTILYAVPRASVLGALLLTAYYGGAIATHLRLDNPLFSHLLFPVYLAVLMWGALWLVDENVRAVVPLRQKR